MDNINILGIIAAILTTSSFLPQVIKTWQSKSAKDLSIGMFLTMTTGIILWLIYGIIKNDLPIILANAVTFIFCSLLLYFKMVFKD